MPWKTLRARRRVEPFTWSLAAFETLINNPVYLTIAMRTVVLAFLVTITDALLALPIAYYMARIASPRTRHLMVVAVLVAGIIGAYFYVRGLPAPELSPTTASVDTLAPAPFAAIAPPTPRQAGRDPRPDAPRGLTKVTKTL